MTPKRPYRQGWLYSQKRKAERWGRWAELWVAFVLRLRGYKLKARRFRCPFGEIDLIVEKHRTIHFIEVKYRSDPSDTARAHPGLSSRKRLYRTAQYYMTLQSAPQFFQQDFHIVVVTRTLSLQWFHNVFIDFD